MSYPRVLVVAMSRINARDTANNGLLLRNIFGAWPRECLAQIYSSGDNADEGFFGRYYQLGPQDRRMGGLFYRLKAEEQRIINTSVSAIERPTTTRHKLRLTRMLLKRILVDTGFYEMVFRPRLSAEMLACVKEFQPDIIFAQGYCLTFTWLPIMLANHLHLPIAYYPTDDWPNETYRSHNTIIPIISWLVNHAVTVSSRHLVDKAIVRLAFNQYMQEEYMRRYGKKFAVLMHGDEYSRFQAVRPQRMAAPDKCWIVGTGLFNHERLPLIHDLDAACDILTAKGLQIKATIFPVNQLPEMSSNTHGFRNIHFEPCPTHNGLAAILQGADILFLPERFGGTAHGIRLSVSSKAHLFMFSGKPIVVYSDPVTGIARYAQEDGWALVVDRRDPYLLGATLEKIMTDSGLRERLIIAGSRTAMKNHDITAIRASFYALLCSVVVNSTGAANGFEIRASHMIA
jgi:glycosyltransferase involved in cell wall biosynthesis